MQIRTGLNAIQNRLLTQPFRFFPSRAINNHISPHFPKSVDINLIGRCNLNCPWCWGPEHNAKESVSFSQWRKLLGALPELGTKSVIFSGGEPLLKKWLPDLAEYAHKLGLRTTLSTNAILLKDKAKEILPFIDDIGIPLDGHTHAANKIMRVGNFIHFKIALDALRFIQSEYPSIDLTLRTVVAKPNLESVSLIGKTLLDNGINPTRLRWKLYQINPIGPRKDEISNGDWLISLKEFEKIVDDVKKQNPQFNIKAQAMHESIHRYFIIFPDGEAHIIIAGKDDLPENMFLGNIIKDTKRVLNNLHELPFNYLKNNDPHGQSPL